MELREYQQRAMTTCTESSNNFSYMILNLVGELGEFAGKVAKEIRKGKMTIDRNILQMTEGNYMKVDFDEDLKKEAGDILWELSGLCTVMGWSLEDIAQLNLDKLASRKERGVIVGDGDNR
jgi:NTP pyrophosphatase (non-canonical NTP hydrolase)